MENSLKAKSVSGFFWNAISKYSTMIVQFITQVLIARVLVPEDYGITGMISIFLGIAYIFIDSGFGTALVRKKNKTQEDCSTVFIFNLGTALFLYIILFFSAPLIADFYNEPLLIPVTRITSLAIVINATMTIQYSILYSSMDFKTMSLANMIGTIFAAFLGLLLVYQGFGLWALVAQNLSKLLVTSIYLWYKSSWVPSFVFSKKSFIELFSFGSKILADSLINTIYDNLYSVLIGKIYSKRDLGLYSKACNYSRVPMSVTVGLLDGLAYPVMCSVQNDDEKLRSIYRKYIRVVSYIAFPIMAGVAAISDSLVICLLTEKWIEIVPLIKIICVGAMLEPVLSINLDAFLVKGRSDINLKLGILQKIIAIPILIGCIPFGLFGFCSSYLLISLIKLILNTHQTNKVIGVSLFQHIKDIFPALFLSFIMAVIVFFSGMLIPNALLRLIIGVILGILIYFGGSKLFKIEELDDTILIIKTKILKKS